MDIDKNIAHNIRKYRKLRGMTQKQLASSLNYHSSTIQKWETEKNTVKTRDLENICRKLNINMTEIMTAQHEIHDEIRYKKIQQSVNRYKKYNENHYPPYKLVYSENNIHSVYDKSYEESIKDFLHLKPNGFDLNEHMNYLKKEWDNEKKEIKDCLDKGIISSQEEFFQKFYVAVEHDVLKNLIEFLYHNMDFEPDDWSLYLIDINLEDRVYFTFTTSDRSRTFDVVYCESEQNFYFGYLKYHCYNLWEDYTDDLKEAINKGFELDFEENHEAEVEFLRHLEDSGLIDVNNEISYPEYVILRKLIKI